MLWGKSVEIKGTTYLLPLLSHLADVAAVFEALLEIKIYSKRLQSLFNRPIMSSDSQRLACIAAIHDIAKSTPGFQNKNTPGIFPVHGHIIPLSGLFIGTIAEYFNDIFSFLISWDDADGVVISEYLSATFSHHGTPLVEFDNPVKAGLWPQNRQAPTWVFAEQLANNLRTWFPEAFSPEAFSLPRACQAQHYFAGLVMLADWIGSDTRFFPVLRNASEGHEIDFSRRAAQEALQAIGLDTTAFRTHLGPFPPFERQFTFRANPLQDAVDDIPLHQEGGIAIIEAETGLGKTEAAFRFFTRLWFEGLVDGLYFANPLRFAATQLFNRLTRFVASTFDDTPPPTVLAVPGYLRVDTQQGTWLPGFHVLWDDDPDRLNAERRWAAEHPKRFLAAPMAVGTIDQALLGTLRVRHAHLRLAALCRSLLVIDEVHASDVYMTKLTLDLLEFFHRAGGQVLLLSATLGGQVRQQYLNCFGPGPRRTTLAQCLAVPYPAITTQEGTLAIDDTRPMDSRKKPIRVHPASIQNAPQAVADLAARSVAAGGRVLVLRNAIRTVLETLAALEELVRPALLFQVAGLTCPHHSRYARSDRQILDAAVEDWFGANGTCQAAILVASPTLEQSLDVDFDVLITDLCPMDVLLQRLGRLHRHRRRDTARPLPHAMPRCHLLTPKTFCADSLRAARNHQYGTDRAYGNLPAVMATWERVLAMDVEDEAFRIPEMSRDLVENALHPEALAAVANRYGLQQELDDLIGRQGAWTKKASLASINWSKPFTESAGTRDALTVGTRLGLGDRSVRFPSPIPSPFGTMVEELTIPQWMAPDIQGDLEPVVLETTESGFRFQLATIRYRYDRYGLSKEAS